MKRLLAFLLFVSTPAFAKDMATLRQVVVVDSDTVTLGDLIATPITQSGTAVFASPEPGETGVIQVSRITEAASGYGITTKAPEWNEVSITRAARNVGADDARPVILTKAAAALGANIADLELTFIRIPSDIKIETAHSASLQLSYFSFDALSGRFEARLFVPGSARISEVSPLIATGTIHEMVDVVKLKHSVDRGKHITASDIEMVRIKRAQLAPNAIRNLDALKNMVARRALNEETFIRTNDIDKAQMVTRNEMVLIVYETAAMSVSTRGKALTNGALDDVVEIQNPVSKRNVMATVIGEGKVLVSAPFATRRVAQLSTSN